jgi:hypothetical protein
MRKQEKIGHRPTHNRRIALKVNALAKQGKIAKARIALDVTEKCVRLDSVEQAQAKFPAEPRDNQGIGAPDHSWAAESLLLSVDEEDLEAIIENLRSNAAAAT